MARLGIVIGVSENALPLQSLRACANDAKAISGVLKQTGRFDDVLVLTDRKETSSALVKDQLASFIERHKGSEIEEVVFYFSGHGDFAGSEFYFILSDYDQKARNRTSLPNAELDEMIRGLAPKLFVKIVDACHSGTSYIKSNEHLYDFLKSAKSGFQNVYFLYSSQGNEPSWATDDLSAFTECLLKEVGRREAGVVRYRDLMNAASDYFEAAGDQTPQFVTQADFTEAFCDASPEMQKFVEQFVPLEPLPSGDTANSFAGKSKATIVDRIRKSDELFCDRDEAFKVLEGIATAYSDGPLPTDLNEIFKWNKMESAEKRNELTAVGDWLSKNSERSFFAKPSYKRVSYKKRVPKGRGGYPIAEFSFSVSKFLGREYEGETELVDATRLEVSGYDTTCELPFHVLNVRLEPKFKSVLPIELHIVPIVSPTHVRMFWMIQQFVRSDWNTHTPSNASSKWESQQSALKDTAEISTLVLRIKSELITSAEKIISSNWPEPVTVAPTLDKAHPTQKK